MVLPTAPPASLSVSQILTEFGIAAGTQKRISNDLFPLVGGTAGATCSLAASFSGKSAVVGGVYNSAASIFGVGANCRGVAISPSDGSIYVCGWFTSSSGCPISNFATNPSGTSGTLPGSSIGRVFVAKWNSSGTYQGAAIVYSATTGPTGMSVACDSTGAVYLGGYYYESTTVTTFATNPSGSAGTLPAPSTVAGYVAKWNSSGVYQGSAIVSTAYATGQGITVDSSDNVLLCGYYNASSAISNFGTNPSGTSGTLPAPSGIGSFIAKWNSSGVYQGSAYVDGSTTTEIGVAVKGDSAGNVYLCGYYNASSAISNFGTNPSGTAGTIPSPSGQGSFIVKWNSSGVYQSSAYVDGAGSETAQNITVDSSNNVYLTGTSATTTANISNFGTNPSGTAGSIPVPSSGGLAFIAKWNSSGVYQGAAIFFGASYPGGTSAACDSNGNIYMGGNYGGAASVSNFATNPSSSAASLPAPLYGGSADFVVKWNSSGTYQTAALVGNPANTVGVTGITTDSSRNIYLCGYYYGNGSTCGITSFATTPNQSSSAGNLPAPSGDNSIRGFIVKWSA